MQQLSKTEFFNKYSNRILKIHNDDTETGDFQLFCPEESHIATKYMSDNYEIASIYESQDGKEYIMLDNDSGTNPYKTGYIILIKN